MKLYRVPWACACVFAYIPVHVIISCLILFSFDGVSGEESDPVAKLQEIHSSATIYTCCKLDLSGEESTCKFGRNDGRSDLSSKKLQFSEHVMAENVSIIFPIEVTKPSCRSGSPKKVFISKLAEGNGEGKLLKNGYLKVDTDHYPPAEYCINAMNETTLEFLVCPQACDGHRPCIHKCCSLDKIYSFGINSSELSKGCQVPRGEDYFKPIFYDDYSTKSEKLINDAHFIEHYPTRTFKWTCPLNKTTFYLFPHSVKVFNEKTPFNFQGIIFRIRKDGMVVFKHSKDGECTILEPEKMCIDGVTNYGNEDLTYRNDETEMVLFLCVNIKPTENVETKTTFGLVYGIIMLASSIFLLLTIATYCALWERMGSANTWTLLSHLACLYLMYIFLGVAHIIGVTAGHDYLGSTGCVSIGIINHFLILSTFSWLLFTTFDMWWTFRAFTPRSGERSKGFSRYIKYSIFGWGIPLVFVITGIILDNRYPEDECHTLLTPAYGKDSCFPQQKALGIYMYYPIAVMIVMNLIFFAITISKLYLYRQSTKIATNNKQAQFFVLFLKMFFITGALWIFEVVSWWFSDTGYYYYWMILDLLNVFRSIAIFVIFVCKRDIIFALEEKYTCLKPFLLPFAWIFKRQDSSREETSMMTRTSTLRQNENTKESELMTTSNNKMN